MPRHPQDRLRIVKEKKTRRGQGVQKMTSAKALQLLQRRYSVWSLRKQGHSVRVISETLGHGEETIRGDIVIIAQRLSKIMGESVEESRFLQIERLDALLVKFQPLAESGSVQAASMVLQIEARRSKLLALDLPEQKKLEVTGIREYVGINLDEV